MSYYQHRPLPQIPQPSRVEPPKTSWWLQPSREAFQEAYQRELPRMQQARVSTPSEDRVLSTHYGKV